MFLRESPTLVLKWCISENINNEIKLLQCRENRPLGRSINKELSQAGPGVLKCSFMNKKTKDQKINSTDKKHLFSCSSYCSILFIQVYAPTSNAEVEWFYKNLQDLLELTPKKDVLFITENQNAKVRSQETPGVTGKFGLEIQNEAWQRLIEFCQENALVIANTLFQQHKRRLYT